MTLRYHNGEDWQPSGLWKSSHEQKAILVCGGPSMNSIDLSKLRGPNKTIFGLNNTYPKVYPDVWLGVDDPHCYNRHVFYEPFIKILRGGYNDRLCEGREIYSLPNLFYASLDHCKYVDLFHRFSKNTGKFVWHWDAFTLAINIILYMGYREIYLVGCDLSTEKSVYHSPDQTIPEELVSYNQSLYDKLYGYLIWINKNLAQLEDLKIYSMSPLSRINNIFNYKSIEELNVEIYKNLPPLGPLYHTKELDSLK